MPAPSAVPPPVRPESIAPAEEVFYASSEREMDLHELFDVLVRGKWIILGCLLAVLLPTVAWTLSQPSRYTSYAVVLIDKPADDLSTLRPQSGRLLAQEADLENELLVLRESYPLAEEAARTVLRTPAMPGTSRRPTVVAPGEDGRPPTVREVALRLQQAYVSAAPASDEVDAVRISGVSTDPAEAAFLANVYAEAFTALTRTESRAGVAASRTFLEAQVADKGTELAALDEAVRAFMDREDAVALDQETSQLVSQIAALEAERDAADVEVQRHRATIAAVQSELARVEPGLARRPASDVDGQLAAAQERLRELQAQVEPYYARNPELRGSDDVPEFLRIRREEMARLEDRVATLSAEIAATAAVGGGGPGDTQSAFQRSATLRAQLVEAPTALRGAEATRAQLGTRLAAYDRELEAIPNQSVDLARLQRDRLAAERLYQSLNENLQQAEVSEQSELGSARVIRPAFVASVPFAPRRLQTVLVDALLGLVLGVAGAIARVRLDRRLSRPDDIQKAGYALLGTIPDFTDTIRSDFGGQERVEVDGRRVDTRLVALLNPMTTASETYRALRTSVQFSRPDADVQTILVTSSSPSEGKSITASNLALVLAQAGRRVLLIDADLRRPTLHTRFDHPLSPGLAEVVFDDEPLRVERTLPVADNLWVLTAGQRVPNPSELLGSKRMRDVIEQARALFDVVVFDVPPVLAATDAVLLSTQADATLVVARAGVTKDFQLEATVSALLGVGAHVIGVVLNGFDLSHSYGYKYKYMYRYQSKYAYGNEKRASA